MSIRINKIAILALFGLFTLAVNGQVVEKKLQNLKTAPATDAHEGTKVAKYESEIRITRGMQIMEQNKDQFGSAFITRTKDDAVKAKEGEKEVQMLLSLISLFGSLTVVLVFVIIKSVYHENEESKRVKAFRSDNAMEIKDIQAASKDIIVSQLNKIQKTQRASKEENVKLINAPASSRPSALTLASSEDLEASSFSSKSSSRMKNMNDPFQIKKLRIDVQSKSDPIEKEQSKSAMLTAVAKPEMKKAGKMMRIFSKKDVSKKDDSKKDDVKYDRKEVKQPLSAATAKTKTSTLKKVGGWK